MTRITTILVVGLLGLCLTMVSVANDEIRNHPGYVSVDTQAILGDVEPSVEIFLERPLLRMLVGATAESEPEIAEFFNQLDLVQVRIFENLEEITPRIVESTLNEVKKLKKKGWGQVVRVPDPQEPLNILLRTDGEGILGLAVFAASPGEWVFINVVGSIDPELFGRFLGELGPGLIGGEVDVLGEILGIVEPMELDEEMEDLLDEEVELTHEQLRRVVGDYMIQSGEFGGETLHVRLNEENDLVGYLEEEEPFSLVPLSETEFVIPELEAVAESKTDASGKVTSIAVEVEGTIIVANRI